MIHEININSYVWVQLTEEGRRIHAKQFMQLRQDNPGITTEYEPPKEDAKGWSQFQIWVLMEIFGEHLSSVNQPFETVIRIDSSDLKPEAERVCEWEKSEGNVYQRPECYGYWVNRNDNWKCCPYCGGEITDQPPTLLEAAEALTEFLKHRHYSDELAEINESLAEAIEREKGEQ